MIKELITLLYDLLVVGKTVAGDIAVSGDKACAKRLKKAIEENNQEKVQNILSRDFIELEKTDIMGVCTTPEGPGVILSVSAAVKFRQLFKDLRRCRRSKRGA